MGTVCFKDGGSKPEVVFRFTILHKIRAFFIDSDSPRLVQRSFIKKKLLGDNRRNSGCHRHWSCLSSDNDKVDCSAIGKLPSIKFKYGSCKPEVIHSFQEVHLIYLPAELFLVFTLPVSANPVFLTLDGHLRSPCISQLAIVLPLHPIFPCLRS